MFNASTITFESPTGPATVIAVPDSGSDYNVISLALVSHPGLQMSENAVGDLPMCLLDGATISARGTLSCCCRSGKTSYREPRKFLCKFHVLESIISPLIMSASFLYETKTMTEHRERLVARPIWTTLPKVCALGQTRRRLICSINGQNVEVLADSGSDIDLISLDVVLEKGWSIKETEQAVVLANGQRISACGVCDVQLSVAKDGKIIPMGSTNELGDLHRYATGSGATPEGHDGRQNELVQADLDTMRIRPVIQSRFYVLAGISVEALIGAAFVESLKVFSHHAKDLFTRPEEVPGINRISLAQRARRCVSKLISESINAQDNGIYPLVKKVLSQTNFIRGQHRPLQEQLNHADQRENARREAANAESLKLTGEERTKFDLEEGVRKDEYEAYRRQLVRALSLNG